MVDSEHTFLFADLAGFTALTEAHGDARAADLADEFCGWVKALLPDEGAEAVKTIGDAVMVRLSDAGDAVRLTVRVTDEIGAQHGVPSVRVGMHTGPAVERAGDWFGATVNTAARVSVLARGGEVLVTEATFRAVGELDDVELREHGRHELRNVAEPVFRLPHSSGRFGASGRSANRSRLPTSPAGSSASAPARRLSSSRRSCATRCRRSDSSPERSSEEPVAVVTSRPVAVSGRRRWSHASPRGRVSRRVA